MLLLAACATSKQAIRPEVARVRLALAQRLADRGEWAAALEAAEAACQAAPGDPGALILRGTILRERGLLDEAQTDLLEAVQHAPDSAPAHSSLAIVYERQHRPADAEKEHRRALELAPNEAHYMNNLGYALLLHGKAREAVPVLVMAVRAGPTNVRARNNLGFAYAVSGDFPRAAQQFEFAGSPAEAKCNLGVAYERTGNIAQALAHYREALRLDPELRRARENLDRVVARSAQVPPARAPSQSPESTPQELAGRLGPAPVTGGLK